MSKRISKKVREEAIEALLCCADSRVSGDWYRELWICDITSANGPAGLLAGKAWISVLTACNLQLRYLEAAALLLDAWCPGDPVVLL